MIDLDRLVFEIEREIESVECDTGEIPSDFADGLCDRFADDWNLYLDDGTYPDWLMWLVLGALNKQGITDL